MKINRLKSKAVVTVGESDWSTNLYPEYSYCVQIEGREGIWANTPWDGFYQSYCISFEEINEIINEPTDADQFNWVPWVMSYLTLSQNALITLLNQQVIDVVGAIEYDINVGLNTTSNLINAIDSSLGNLLGDIELDLVINHNNMTSQLTTLDSKIDTQLNSINDELDTITYAVTNTDSGLLSTLTDYLGGVLDTLWYSIDSLISELQTAYFDITTWFMGAWDMMLLAVQNTVTPVLETVTGSLAFIANEIWSAVDTALQPVIDIIDSLGDLYDWFAMDFMTWLDTTFTFSDEDLTTGFNTVMSLLTSILQVESDKPI